MSGGIASPRSGMLVLEGNDSDGHTASSAPPWMSLHRAPPEPPSHAAMPSGVGKPDGSTVTTATSPRRPLPLNFSLGMTTTGPVLDSHAPYHLGSPTHRLAPHLAAPYITANAQVTNVAAPAPALATAMPTSSSGGDGGGARAAAAVGSLEMEIPTTLANERRRQLADVVSRFEQRHRDFNFTAHRALKTTVREQGSDAASGRAFDRAVVKVRRNRLFVPEAAPKQALVGRPSSQTSHRRREADVPEEEWRLAESIWGGRERWGDSKDFWDTERCLERAMITDWNTCLEKSKLTEFLLKHDAGMKVKDPAMIPKKELDAFLSEMEGVFVANARLFLQSFDYYATLGTSDDLFHIQQLGYFALIEECDLVVKNSKAADMGAFDLIFVVANSSAPREQSAQNALGIYAAPEKKKKKKTFAHDSKLGLSRAEYVQVLCRMAIGRYVLSGKNSRLSDVSDAVVKFFETMKAKCDPGTRQDSNTFRDDFCYIEPTDAILRLHEPALRMLFERYAKEDGDVGGKRAESTKLLSVVEWVQLARDLAIIDEDLSVDDAKLVFLWSRLRVIDEDSVKSREKVENLAFWDFLEAIVRCAHCKALPTDEQLEERECADAFEFLNDLKENDYDNYEEFISRSDGEWWNVPRQPIEKAVGHLLMLMVRTLNHKLGRLEAQIPPKSNIKVRNTPIRTHGGAGSAGFEKDVLEQLGAALDNQKRINDKASAIILAGCRGALTRARLRLRPGNATTIQALLRARTARRRWAAKRSASKTVQRYYRGHRTRTVMLALSEQAAAYLAQLAAQKQMRPKYARERPNSTSSVPSGVALDDLPGFEPKWPMMAFKKSFYIGRPSAQALLHFSQLGSERGPTRLRRLGVGGDSYVLPAGSAGASGVGGSSSPASGPAVAWGTASASSLL